MTNITELKEKCSVIERCLPVSDFRVQVAKTHSEIFEYISALESERSHPRQNGGDMKTQELIEKYGRAQLGIDGNCAFALLGADLQEGEAEFVELQPFLAAYKNETNAQLWAARLAMRKLRERLDAPNLSYYFGPSHPYGG